MFDYNGKGIFRIFVDKKHYERGNSIKKLRIFDHEEKCFEYYGKIFEEKFYGNLYGQFIVSEKTG